MIINMSIGLELQLNRLVYDFKDQVDEYAVMIWQVVMFCFEG